MKPFESFIASRMKEYITYRKDLGYKTAGLQSSLRHFDLYVQQNASHWDAFTPLFFLRFREVLRHEPSAVNCIMHDIRRFFQFIVRQGIMEDNPLKDIPPLKAPLFIPFVFSEKETEEFLFHAREGIRKRSAYFLKDLSVYCALSLMVRCGLRISEPLHIVLSHFLPKEGCIYIENTKFRKDRLIPIPKPLTREIANYLSVRRTLIQDDTNPYLFSGNNNRHIDREALIRGFDSAVKKCGLCTPRKSAGNVIFGSPTPHSLRHSFAINALKRIKARGGSPQDALPVLAAYMGHTKYRDTAVYLKVLDAQARAALFHVSTCLREDI
jgi:integrase/recombinase XerD